MTYATATQYWMALSPSQKQMFYDIASKSEGNHTAFEWFMHLVPDPLKDDPEQVTTYMQGGTVTVDGTEHVIPDRDVSRITSGENGGEYTTDNTIMEDSSVNRSRGADNMTDAEYDTALEANAADVELIDSADVATEQLQQAPELLGEALGTVADVAIAGVAAYKAGNYVYNNLPSDWDEDDKVLATGGATIGTAALAFTPPGQALVGLYCTWKLIGFGVKLIRKFA